MRISLDPWGIAPHRAHDTDAGMDIMSPRDEIVKAHNSVVIPTGVHVELKGAAGVILPKSGLNIKHDILAFGVVDEGYSGQIVVKLYNLSDEDYHVHKGDKITQMLVVPVRYEVIELVDTVESGERGTDGFGSTGR